VRAALRFAGERQLRGIQGSLQVDALVTSPRSMQEYVNRKDRAARTPVGSRRSTGGGVGSAEKTTEHRRAARRTKATRSASCDKIRASGLAGNCLQDNSCVKALQHAPDDLTSFSRPREQSDICIPKNDQQQA